MAIIGITRHYVLAAGGTGGHMVPAHALAAELNLSFGSCDGDIASRIAW